MNRLRHATCVSLRDQSRETRAFATACVLGLCAVAWTAPAHAQAWVPGKGQSSLSMIYEQKRSTEVTESDGASAHFGTVIDRTLHLNLDLGLSDRWALSLGLPFQSDRYTGTDPHDPRVFPFANNQRFLDDGRFHAGWSDWSVGLRYQLRTRPFLVTPFIAYTQPSHNYTFFAHSAFGTEQKALKIGVYLGQWFPPPWQNLFWQLGYGYTFEQSTKHLDPLANRLLMDDRHVNHGKFSLELGYQLTPRFDARALIERTNSYGNGINASKDFSNPDGSPNFNNLFYHDQLLIPRFTTVTVGVDYQLNAHYQLSFDLGRTFSAANAHIFDYDASFGISRSF